MITKRQQQLVSFLKKQASPVSVGDLAKLIKSSTRTVRYELAAIQAAADTLGLRILRQASIGVQLLNKDNPKWNELLEQVNYHNKEYRQYHVLVYLLSNKQCSLSEVAKQLDVSRQTINRDVQRLIERFPVLFEGFKRTTHGCCFENDERMIREVIKNNVLNVDMIRTIQEMDEMVHWLEKNKIANWLVLVQQQLEAEFEPASYAYLESLGLLFLFRSRFATSHDGNLNEDAKQFYANHEIPFDELAKELMYQAILGARLAKGSHVVDEAGDDLAQALFEALSDALGFMLDERDAIAGGLLLHLRATIHRAKAKQHIENPLLEEVKVSLGLVYELVADTIKSFEVKHDLRFSSHEIGFITMHLGAILQSQVYVHAPIKIAIVCQHGMATSRLLLSRVEALLPNHDVSGPYSMKEFHRLDQMKVFDYVITTIPLGIENELVVSPIMSRNDVANLEKTIWNYTYWKQCDVLMNNYRINQVNELKMSDLIKKEHIQLTTKTYNYKQAIEVASAALILDGVIEPSYVEKMIWAVETLGPYMVILPRVAFVHASAEDGVNKNGISLLRLDKPIAFNKENTAPVQAIFVLASVNSQDGGLLKLVRILEEEGNMNVLLHSDDVDDILRMKG